MELGVTFVPDPHTHLSDDEIDRYAAGYLDGRQLHAVEEQILVCHECAQRAREVDELVRGLAEFRRRGRSQRGLQLAAAVLLAASAGYLLGHRSPGLPPGGQAPSNSAQPEALGAAVVRWMLKPVERGAELQRYGHDKRAKFVVLAVDAQEVVFGDHSVQVALRRADGPELMRASLAASPSGFLELAVPSQLLRSGDYVIEVTRGDESLQVPFRVDP